MPTPNLDLVPLAAAQAQKHVTVNEALARLDAVTQLAVLDRTTTDPPPAPADGDRYLIPEAATGPWQDRADAIAAWDAAVQGWLFLAPRPGWRVWVVAEDLLLVFGAQGWLPLAPATFGVNATPDAANRLAVASPAILLDHEGAGMQAKINKASPADTGAFLFQTGYSGRAEFGLIGSDDFALKTSPDGATFTEAMRTPVATARPDFPQGVTLSGGAPLTRFEEGDWVPELVPNSVSNGDWAGATGITVESARYTRIGRMVHLRAAFAFDGVPATQMVQASVQTLRGVPFPPSNISAALAQDFPGIAMVTGAIVNGRNALASAILDSRSLIFLNYVPPSAARPNADALVLLDISYEAAA